MFEIPDSKRVRRDELDSNTSRQPSPDEDLAAAFLSNFTPTFTIPRLEANNTSPSPEIPSPPPKTSPTTTPTPEDDTDTGFSLFGTNTTLAPFPAHHTTNTPTGKHVSISTSTTPLLPLYLTTSNTSALLPRQETYYLAAPPSPQTLSRIHASSISAAQIRQIATIPCPGLFLPWRSYTFSTHKTNPNKHSPQPTQTARPTALTTPNADDETQLRHRRTRAGKKTRIKIRRKHEASRAARAAREAAERDKAAHEREKRAKVNRAKQLKKREKARVARAVASGVGEGVEGTVGAGQEVEDMVEAGWDAADAVDDG